MAFILLLSLFMLSGEITLYDFSSEEKSGTWYTVNDGVMGGRSESKIIFNGDSTVTFKGSVSPENNGGFASVRSQISLGEGYQGVALRVKGDGNMYSIRFRTNKNFDAYAYQTKIKTEKDTWMEFKLPFDEFVPTFRGNTLTNKPVLKSAEIAQIGILIADKQFGKFEVIADWIKFYP